MATATTTTTTKTHKRLWKYLKVYTKHYKDHFKRCYIVVLFFETKQNIIKKNKSRKVVLVVTIV